MLGTGLHVPEALIVPCCRRYLIAPTVSWRGDWRIEKPYGPETGPGRDARRGLLPATTLLPSRCAPNRRANPG